MPPKKSRKPKVVKADDQPQIDIVNVDFDPNVKTKKNAKGKQLRNSNFYVTLNTNQRFNELSEEYQVFNAKLQKVIDQLFAKDNIHNVIILKDEKAEFTKEFIKSINIEKVIELGPVSKCVHLHAVISIAQYTPVHLNYAFIKDFVCERMNLTNLYLNNKVFFDNKMGIIDYINKGKRK